MKKKGETKRQRILIYYAIAIVLPYDILGLLAFRGIKNDQALVEREQRTNLLEAGQQIIRETDAYLSSIEKSFAEIIDSIAIPGKTIFTDSILNLFSAQNQAVAGIFFVSASGDPFLLNKGLLYVSDDFLAVSDVSGSQTTQYILEKGWQIEFRENDFRKASAYYKNVLPDVTNVQSRGEILSTIGRVQKKLKMVDEAIKTYDLLSNDYSEILIQNKLPLGAVALLEKSLLYLGKKDTISALKTIHFLISKMQKPESKLSYSYYNNFLSKIDEIISLCKNSRNEETGSFLERINILKDSLSMTEKHTEYQLAFLENSEIMSGYITKPGKENNNHRSKTQINAKSYLFSLVSGNDQGQWVLIMDPDYILNNVVHQSILGSENKSNFYWELTDVNGGLLLKSEYIPENTSPVYTVFPSNLPS